MSYTCSQNRTTNPDLPSHFKQWKNQGENIYIFQILKNHRTIISEKRGKKSEPCSHTSLIPRGSFQDTNGGKIWKIPYSLSQFRKQRKQFQKAKASRIYGWNARKKGASGSPTERELQGSAEANFNFWLSTNQCRLGENDLNSEKEPPKKSRENNS